MKERDLEERMRGGLELIKVTCRETVAGGNEYSCSPTDCGPHGSCSPRDCGPQGSCSPTDCGPKGYALKSNYQSSCEPCCPACRPNGG